MSLVEDCLPTVRGPEEESTSQWNRDGIAIDEIRCSVTVLL